MTILETLFKKQVSVDIHKLATITDMELETLHPLSDKCCIYKVPTQLRELNEKAYTPRVVFIGPFHHGKPELRVMEEHKRRYLKDFVERGNVPTLHDLMRTTEENEKRLKECYAENINIPREHFIKMMLVDSVFIVEFLLRIHFKDFRSNDRVFGKQLLESNIRYDIFLLENQVPFFFLAYLLSMFDQGLSLIKLVLTCLASSILITGIDDNTIFQAQHLVDLLRICLSPSVPNPRNQYNSLSTPTITQLHQAGVKFKSSSSTCLLDIQFMNGILEIPRWKITDYAEILFRNIQAFEQSHDFGNYIGDYICMMDLLINSHEDLELLVQNGIIENWMQDNQAVTTLINNLGKHNSIYSEFYFSDLIKDLNAYCKITRHKWKATLKDKYFNNPWTIISFIAAIVLVILTIIQTICSLFQVV